MSSRLLSRIALVASVSLCATGAGAQASRPARDVDVVETPIAELQRAMAEGRVTSLQLVEKLRRSREEQ